MKAMKMRSPKALMHTSLVRTCDNSGAKVLKIVSIKGQKTVKNRMPGCRIGDLFLASVVDGELAMRKTVVFGVLVRQKQWYRRPDGTRMGFKDNAAVVLKDDKGNPKGTIFKGPIAKEACDRWPGIAKVAGIVV